MISKAFRKILLTASLATLAGCASSPSEHASSPAKIFDGHSQPFSGTSSALKESDGFKAQEFAGFANKTAKNEVVNFKFDQYRLRGDQKQQLAGALSYLLNHPEKSVMIAGYTDPVGSSSYNFNLGQKRADSVRQYLIDQGVPPNQVCTVSFGDTKLLTDPKLYANHVNESFYKHRQKVIMAYHQDRRAVIGFDQPCQGASDHA